MKNYPIFLLPKGKIMMTAKIENNAIKLLKETKFPSKRRYSIGENGYVACIDSENELLIIGQINFDGQVEHFVQIPFPKVIYPRSILIYKDNIIIGGFKHAPISQENYYSSELLVSYSIKDMKFIPIEIPIQTYDKSIDDLLVDENRIIAVDNIVFPKYLIECDFSDPNNPSFIKLHNLPNNGTYEHISKGALNKNYIALLSSSGGMYGNGNHINIFKKGNYSEYAILSQWNSVETYYKNKIKKYYWNDIMISKIYNMLLISASEYGVGIYKIIPDLINDKNFDETKSIVYHNEWSKKLIKILHVPNNEKKIILIFEEGDSDSVTHSYAIEDLDKISIIAGFSNRRNL